MIVRDCQQLQSCAEKWKLVIQETSLLVMMMLINSTDCILYFMREGRHPLIELNNFRNEAVSGEVSSVDEDVSWDVCCTSD